MINVGVLSRRKFVIVKFYNFIVGSSNFAHKMTLVINSTSGAISDHFAETCIQNVSLLETS